jgi:hypothetical protein
MKAQYLIFSVVIILFYSSCRRTILRDYEDPEIQTLRDGIRASVSVGYCSSIAYSFFKGEEVPNNVVIVSQKEDSGTKSVILQVLINDSYKLPLNSSVGQITIAGTWEEKGTWDKNGGVISVLFTDIDVLKSNYEFVGFYTLPIKELEDGRIKTLFGGQDLVFGETPDDLIRFGFSTDIVKFELNRFDENNANVGEIALIEQNVWFTKIDRNNTSSNSYDDEYSIDGGGQIYGSNSNVNGILFHAILNTKYRYSNCELNPTSGVGFIQNIKTDTSGDLDLGHAFLDFHNKCDGKAHVKVATGKYIFSIDKDIPLNLY